jgi:hypothetical protein
MINNEEISFLPKSKSYEPINPAFLGELRLLKPSKGYLRLLKPILTIIFLFQATSRSLPRRSPVWTKAGRYRGFGRLTEGVPLEHFGLSRDRSNIAEDG